MVSYKLGNIVIDLPMMTIITYYSNFSQFAVFHLQQTISLKNKNGLKSILVRRFFEVFLIIIVYL